MAEFKREKYREALKTLASEFILTNSSGASMITVTNADVSKDFKRSTIFFTAFPENKESTALAFLKRKRSDFRDYVKSHAEFRRIPFFEFSIDAGEKNRQKIEKISKQQ